MNTSRSNPDLSVSMGEISLKNPIVAASGTFGYGLEFTPFVDLDQLGGFCTKGLSLEPRLGNPVPRVAESGEGMLNAIGLENVGLEKFVAEKLPQIARYSCAVICNFFGNTVEEYARMAEALSAHDRIDALEMNISCPNVKEGGHQFSSQPRLVEEVVGVTRKATSKFLVVKLSPNVTDITETARAAEAAGADALSLTNTHVGMVMDIETRQPYLANITGGLSGPAIKPISVQMVYHTARAVKVPLFGVGGIRTAEDALEYLMAGARAVQVGTANFFDPGVTLKIVEGLKTWCRDNGVGSISELYPL